MNNVILFITFAFVLSSCGGRTIDEYNKMNAEVEELKSKCSTFQQQIHNKNLTNQDITDRQYEIDNISNVLHADERSLSSCITQLKIAESFVRQISTDNSKEDNIRNIYRRVNEINSELKRCARDIASEGTERPTD